MSAFHAMFCRFAYLALIFTAYLLAMWCLNVVYLDIALNYISGQITATSCIRDIEMGQLKQSVEEFEISSPISQNGMGIKVTFRFKNISFRIIIHFAYTTFH